MFGVSLNPRTRTDRCLLLLSSAADMETDDSFGWCDLTDPLGNPFCPLPLPWFILINLIIKVAVGASFALP